MAEVVGLVASVVQLAGAGLKLSQTLYQYADGVASADRRIKDIANEVKLTSFVIQELGTIFEKDETANLISENAVRTANETIKECFAVFTELELKINKGKPGKMGRLMLPFKDNKIELLRSQIDKLKSTLELLMQVLIHAHQVSSEKYNREAEARHREEIKQLLENKKQATKKYEESLRNFSISDGSTAVDDGDRSVKDEDDIGSPSNLINAAGAIGSTINSDTLATCVDHVRSLLADIETLQLVLARKVDGDDHSDHHQKAIGSYFIARSHLDSVLFGNAQANTSVSTATHSKPPNGHVSGALSDERVQEEMKMKMEMEHERARTVAEERMKPESFQKSAEASLYDKERESALLIEREMRLEREARDEVRAKMEREGKVQDLVCRPAAHEDSIEDIPREFPSGAEYRQTKYREEYAPTLRRTSTRTNPETDETPDGRLVIEVPDRIDRPGATRSQLQLSNESSRADDAHHPPLSQAKPTKLEARARGERLWQEELRRRESSSAPARVKSTKRRDSRPPALSQPSQSARDRFPSSSPGYLSEEIEGSSYASSTRIREAKRRPRKDKNEIDQNESQVSYSRQDDSFRTHNPRQILSPQLSLTYSDDTDKEVNGQLGAQVKPDGEEKRRGESGTDYLTKARVAEREKARAEETERRRRRRSEQEQMQQEFWWFSYNMESTSTPSDAYPDIIESNLRYPASPTSMLSNSIDEFNYFPPSAGQEGIFITATGHCGRSHFRSRRDHRGYDSDASDNAGAIAKFESETEDESIKMREESVRRDWEHKREKEGPESRRRRPRPPNPHAFRSGSDAKIEDQRLRKPTPTSESQRQKSSEEEYISPSGEEEVPESDGADGTWDYIHETEKVGRADEVDELLKEWTTLLG